MNVLHCILVVIVGDEVDSDACDSFSIVTRVVVIGGVSNAPSLS